MSPKASSEPGEPTPLRVQTHRKSRGDVTLSEQQMWQLMADGAAKESLASQSTEITVQTNSSFSSEADFWTKMSQGAHDEAVQKGISPRSTTQKKPPEPVVVPPYREREEPHPPTTTHPAQRPQTQGGSSASSHGRRRRSGSEAILEEHAGDAEWASSSVGQMAMEHRRRSVDLAMQGYDPEAVYEPTRPGSHRPPRTALPWQSPRARLSIERVGVVDAVTAAVPDIDPEGWRETRLQARKESLAYQARELEYENLLMHQRIVAVGPQRCHATDRTRTHRPLSLLIPIQLGLGLVPLDAL